MAVCHSRFRHSFNITSNIAFQPRGTELSKRLVPEEDFVEEVLHGFFLVVFISRSIRDNSVLHVPCLEVAVSGAYLIDSHVIVIDEINESILQNDS